MTTGAQLNGAKPPFVETGRSAALPLDEELTSLDSVTGMSDFHFTSGDIVEHPLSTLSVVRGGNQIRAEETVVKRGLSPRKAKLVTGKTKTEKSLLVDVALPVVDIATGSSKRVAHIKKSDSSVKINVTKQVGINNTTPKDAFLIAKSDLQCSSNSNSPIIHDDKSGKQIKDSNNDFERLGKKERKSGVKAKSWGDKSRIVMSEDSSSSSDGDSDSSDSSSDNEMVKKTGNPAESIVADSQKQQSSSKQRDTVTELSRQYQGSELILTAPEEVSEFKNNENRLVNNFAGSNLVESQHIQNAVLIVPDSSVAKSVDNDEPLSRMNAPSALIAKESSLVKARSLSESSVEGANGSIVEKDEIGCKSEMSLDSDPAINRQSSSATDSLPDISTFLQGYSIFNTSTQPQDDFTDKRSSAGLTEKSYELVEEKCDKNVGRARYLNNELESVEKSPDSGMSNGIQQKEPSSCGKRGNEARPRISVEDSSSDCLPISSGVQMELAPSTLGNTSDGEAIPDNLMGKLEIIAFESPASNSNPIYSKKNVLQTAMIESSNACSASSTKALEKAPSSAMFGGDLLPDTEKVQTIKFTSNRQTSSGNGKTEGNGDVGSEVSGEESFCFSQSDLDVTPTKLAQDFFDNTLFNGTNYCKEPFDSLDTYEATSTAINLEVNCEAQTVIERPKQSDNLFDNRQETANYEKALNYELTTKVEMTGLDNGEEQQLPILPSFGSQNATVESDKIALGKQSIAEESECKCDSETEVLPKMSDEIEQNDAERNFRPELFGDDSVSVENQIAATPLPTNDFCSVVEEKFISAEQAASSAHSSSLEKEISADERLFLQTMYSMERADSVFNELSQSVDGSLWLDCTFDLLNADDVFLELPVVEEPPNPIIPDLPLTKLGAYESIIEMQHQMNNQESFVSESFESSTRVDTLQIFDNEEGIAATHSRISSDVYVDIPKEEEELVSASPENSSAELHLCHLEPQNAENSVERLANIDIKNSDEPAARSADMNETSANAEPTTRRSKRLAINEKEKQIAPDVVAVPKSPVASIRVINIGEKAPKRSLTFIAEGFAIKVGHNISSIEVDSEKEFVVRNEQMMNEPKLRKRTANGRRSTVSSDYLVQSKKSNKDLLENRVNEGESASKVPKITSQSEENPVGSARMIADTSEVPSAGSNNEIKRSCTSGGTQSLEIRNNEVQVSITGKPDVQIQMIKSSVQSPQEKEQMLFKSSDEAVKLTTSALPEECIDVAAQENEKIDTNVQPTNARTVAETKIVGEQLTLVCDPHHELDSPFPRARTPEREKITVSEDEPSQAKSDLNVSPLRNWKQLMSTTKSKSNEIEDGVHCQNSSTYSEKKRQPRSGVHSEVSSARRVMISTIKSEGMLSFYDPSSVVLERNLDAIFNRGVEELTSEPSFEESNNFGNKTMSGAVHASLNVEDDGISAEEDVDDNLQREHNLIGAEESLKSFIETGRDRGNPIADSFSQEHVMQSCENLSCDVSLVNLGEYSRGKLMSGDDPIARGSFENKEGIIPSSCSGVSGKIENKRHAKMSVNTVANDAIEQGVLGLVPSSLKQKTENFEGIECSKQTQNVDIDDSSVHKIHINFETEGHSDTVTKLEESDADTDKEDSALQICISEECLEGDVEPTGSRLFVVEQEDFSNRASLDVFTVEQPNMADGGLDLRLEPEPFDPWSETSSQSVVTETSAAKLELESGAIFDLSNENPILSEIATTSLEVKTGARNFEGGAVIPDQSSAVAFVRSYNLRSSPVASTGRLMKESAAPQTPVKEVASITREAADSRGSIVSTKLGVGLNSPSNKRQKTEVCDDNEDESTHPVLCDEPTVRRSPRAKKIKFMQARESASFDSNTEESQGSLVSLRRNWNRDPIAMQRITQESDSVAPRISAELERVMKKSRYMPKDGHQNSLSSSIVEAKKISTPEQYNPVSGSSPLKVFCYLVP